MMQDKALALSYTQIGGLTSILPVAYGNALLPVDNKPGTLLSTLTHTACNTECQLAALSCRYHLHLMLCNSMASEQAFAASLLVVWCRAAPLQAAF